MTRALVTSPGPSIPPMSVRPRDLIRTGPQTVLPSRHHAPMSRNRAGVASGEDGEGNAGQLMTCHGVS
ncbi:hypothetical protein TgHK011_004258 [Trichoderma gracile]|nr:hypothetical protein TgHK011_004258 [Trichoderma gracile]